MSRSNHNRRERAASLAVAALASVLLDYGGAAHLALAASQEFDASRRRPLFAPTRRPPPEPEPAAQAADPVQPTAVETTPNIEVRGIIFGDNHRVAIVKRPSSPQTVDVAVGSDIDGWVVSDILPRGIVLRRDNRTLTVSMPEPGH